MLNCFAFEPRYYPWGITGSSERQQAEAILRTWDQMDQTLMCWGSDKFWNDSPPLKSSINRSWIRRKGNDGKPLEFTRNEIESLFKDLPSKNLLVVYIQGKELGTNTDEVRQSVKEMDPFFSSLGFKRVLVLRDNHNGRFVLSDTER